jgi:hypothetical protein
MTGLRARLGLDPVVLPEEVVAIPIRPEISNEDLRRMDEARHFGELPDTRPEWVRRTVRTDGVRVAIKELTRDG